ncbi:MAG: aminotransferase class I/II-fold pyridoxal phosphate-dependent enzyme [Mariniblastus sp.]|nr:aminotransferase class I/II-fold pyridoxal phosphate-dependent enzyme [Mariniblastus sp.]
MPSRTRDICPRNIELPLFGSRPARPPIHTSAVYHCDSPEQAQLRLADQEPGYVYQRGKHPNAELLSEKCRQLHRADTALITSSGMAAIALALVACLKQGDHVLISNRLYGETGLIVEREFSRFGIESSQVDLLDLDQLPSEFRENTKLVIAETISNPTLRVVDLAGLADLAHQSGALLMVDNTFASPAVCQPLELGADLVVESMSKIMNGHGDLMLGALCVGKQCDQPLQERLVFANRTWGFSGSPMDCWLAERGLVTLFPRVATASATALRVARELGQHAAVREIVYPGLESHPDHELAKRQFDQANAPSDDSPSCLFGHVLTLQLEGGLETATRFIQSLPEIPFCPSLGEPMTTLSHPASTSHRSLTVANREKLGIFPATIRLSIGLESPEFILEALRNSLADLDF